MTDHRAVVGFMNIHPPINTTPTTSWIKFSRDISASHNKPRLRYPQGSEKHKFEEFRTLVDEKIIAKSIHDSPVICDNSFISRYNALTLIFKECGDTIFGRVKHNKRAIGHFVTSPRIQRIQSDIKHLGGALRMTQERFSGEVS
jgi:hypothetical protein